MAEDVRSWKLLQLLIIAIGAHVIQLCSGQISLGIETSSVAATKSSQLETTADVNRPPSWVQTSLQDQLKEGLLENLKMNSRIGFLKAADPEGDTLIYSVKVGSVFSVNSDTGEVNLSSVLDRESSDEIAVTFYASDSSNNQISVDYTIPILDVNDNVPRFITMPKAIQVSEASKVNSVIYNGMLIEDADFGMNSQLDISCLKTSEACEIFQPILGQRSGTRQEASLSLKKSLDYETRTEYDLTLQVKDKGEPQLQSNATMVIQITDAQDMLPKFIYSPVSLVVPENVGEEIELAKFQAQDLDAGIPNPIIFSVVNDPTQMFKFDQSVRESTGVYTSRLRRGAGGIDREAHSVTFNITVRASEMVKGKASNTYVESIVAVTIEDINDNGPVFDKQNYEVTVAETSRVDSLLEGLNIVVNDQDMDSNAKYRLSIEDDKYGTFSVAPSTGIGKTAVTIKVVSPKFMDYETTLYRRQIIKVIAREYETSEARSSTATLTVNLYDTNDNAPVFPPPLPVRSYTVREDTSVGTLVATITAGDADSGKYGRLIYSIHGASYIDKFLVSNSSGELRIAKKLDFETEPLMEFIYTAMDGGGLAQSLRIRIQVTNYNDQAPQFTNDAYKTIVMEGSLSLQPPINVSAVDPENSDSVSYRIVGGNPTGGAFAVGRTSGVMSLTRAVGFQETPGKRGYFELTVEASDNGNPVQRSTSLVVVTVLDLNDHDPIFLKQFYSGEVTEVSAPGTSILTVSATDEDSGENKDISYIIKSGSRDNFIINSLSGSIQVASGANLDTNIYGSKYTVIVCGMDKGSPPRTGTTEVSITVKDSNNQSPKFMQETYFVSLPENVDVNSKAVDVSASDSDNGAVLEYSIKQDSVTAKDKNGQALTSTIPVNYKLAFSIDRTSGRISSAMKLSREVMSQISFIVEARDTKAEQPPIQTATASVVVTITVVDDNKLTFTLPWTPTNPSIVISMPEEEKIDSLVTTLIAKDPITNDPVQQMRKVADSNPSYFRLDETTGKVYLRKRLDYESLSSKTLSFQVEAYTSGPPKKTALTTVYVQVQDVNDHSPNFVQDTYDFSVKESAKYPRQVGMVVATDPDSGTNGQVRYTISGQNANLFSMDASSGVISVAENTDLDREKTPFYNLIVVATDNTQVGGVKRSSYVPLNIAVLDENDNAPRFSATQYVFQKLESDTNTRVGQVFASDEDAGINGQIRFSILSGAEGLFKIDPENGMIETRVNIRGHARGNPYILTVQATDRIGAGQSTSQDVTIFINDLQVNDGKPRFIYPGRDQLEVYIDEESREGTKVYTVQAQDGDVGTSGQLVYGFLSNAVLNKVHQQFDINPTTGEITTAAVLDREVQERYELILSVKDKGSSPFEVTRRLIVRLRDINDNKPTFTDCPKFQIKEPLVLYVQEEQREGVKVGQIRACDKDENNSLYFYITCGNNVSESDGSPPFRINQSTGELFTAMTLDREQEGSYDLCVTVSNSPLVEKATPEGSIGIGAGSRRKRSVGDDLKSTIKVTVFVEDKDDHGPEFLIPQQGYLSAGVMVTALYPTDVIKVAASDKDIGKNADMQFSIVSCTFVSVDKNKENLADAFTIDRSSGVVRTNRDDYLNFINGHFSLDVSVSDRQQRTKRAVVKVYPIQETDKLKFVWTAKPYDVKTKQEKFVSQLSGILGNHKITADGIYYHTRSDGSVDVKRSDLCFHLVRDNEVQSVSQGLQLFSSIQSKTQSVFRAFAVDNVMACGEKMSTELWAGEAYLWWILIGVAGLLFIIIIILLIIICHYWKRYKKEMGNSKPYVVLDPVGIKNDNYEWQENTVHM